MKTKFKSTVVFLFLLLAGVTIMAALTGSVKLSPASLFTEENLPILYLRLFRVAIAIVAGCGLSVSGIVLQAILRNSLAEPYLLGTSSGAGLGAVIGIVIGISRIYLPLAAFLGAILSIILVYALAKQNSKIPQESLILSGVIVSVALSALIVFLISISGNEALHGLSWWLWGSFQVYDLKLLMAAAALVFTGIGIIYIFSQDLNAISIGEEEAMHLGIDIEKVKKLMILITSLITAGLVCICGIIGFVGLMVPHMVRLVVGPNHKILIPSACIAASIFLIFCDVISRVIMPPQEIPIGVITAILGAPTFIILLRKGRKA